MGQTQERLATCKKVNSALDDPMAFFTAESLNSRASDLNRLLDSVGLAQQTLQAADEGISSITNLVEAAQATARQAQQESVGGTTPTTLTGDVAIATDDAATVAGTVEGLSTTTDLSTLNFTTGDEVTLTVGSDTSTFTMAAGDTVNDLVTALDGNASGSVTLNADGAIEATADNNTDTLQFGEGGQGTNLGDLGLDTTTYEPTNTQVAGFTDTLSIQVNDSTAETIDLNTIDTRNALETALGNLTGVTASINGDDNVEITALDKEDSLTISGGDEVGLENGTTDAPYSQERADLESQFNSLREQIDQLAADAGFNGINLLNGDDLDVTFNEDGSSKLSITSVTFDSAGLGINEATTDSFQTNDAIETTLNELDSAVTSLRSQASTFGSNLSVVEAREEFTNNMINTLEGGAADLTLADTNEEGANMLALQTRQQLASTSLSLASQADQNVLRLF
jgi:flagellin-like hook-associated protein FlgL